MKTVNSYIIDGDLLDVSACMESSKVDCFSRVAMLFSGIEKKSQRSVAFFSTLHTHTHTHHVTMWSFH